MPRFTKKEIDVTEFRPLIKAMSDRTGLTREDCEGLEQETLLHLSHCAEHYRKYQGGSPLPFFKVCASRFITERSRQLIAERKQKESLPETSCDRSKAHDDLFAGAFVRMLAARMSDQIALQVGLSYFVEGMSRHDVMRTFNITEPQFRELIAKFRQQAARVLSGNS